MNVIYEYQQIPKELNTLEQHIKANKSLHKYFKTSFDGLKARQYCGILNVDGEDFYILPKIAKKEKSDTKQVYEVSSVNLKIFTYMLMYANDIKVKNEDFSNSLNTNSDNILDVFIQMFARNFFKELQNGIYKEYIMRQENLTTLRGKYLINENLKYNFTNTKIYCEFDEFSEDNNLNQFFLYAIKTLMNFTKNKKLLKMCELALDGVEYKKVDINNINIHFHRLNNRFKDSFEFALLLLKKSIPVFNNGKKSFAFLFDMNSLFEKFIGNIYKSMDESVKTQNERNFGNLKLKPDIIFQNQIIDTKYKKVKNRDDLNTNDKYQMFVYGTNFAKENEKPKNTMLLYPKHIKIVDEDLKLGRDDKVVELKMRSIDLGFSGRYDEYINEIKERIGVLL